MELAARATGGPGRRGRCWTRSTRTAAGVDGRGGPARRRRRRGASPARGPGHTVGAPRLRMLATKPGESGPTGACGYGRLPGAKSDRPRLADPKEESFCSLLPKETGLVQNLDATDARVGERCARPAGEKSGRVVFPRAGGRPRSRLPKESSATREPGATSRTFPATPRPARRSSKASRTSWISANTRAVFFEAVERAGRPLGYNLLVSGPERRILADGRRRDERPRAVVAHLPVRHVARPCASCSKSSSPLRGTSRCGGGQQITLKALSGDAAQSEIARE